MKFNFLCTKYLFYPESRKNESSYNKVAEYCQNDTEYFLFL